jgi:benzoyl-CoA 2,3-dioxygenase component B
MFTYFTDRDGKFQLASLRESAFDPLSRTCDFMLKEEAHHLFVGASGIGRVVERTVQLMKEHDTDDVRPYGGIDVPTLQRYLNFHCSVSLDLFGAETSSNAANYFGAGLKGRYQEERRTDDHQLLGTVRDVPDVRDGVIGVRSATMLTALNETLREDYIADCRKGVDRWNRTLAEVGASLRLPHSAFNRAVGAFGSVNVTPDGEIISAEEWDRRSREWLPTEEDREFVESLMVPVVEPGKVAGWIAAPTVGVHGRQPDFEYVRLA